MKFIREHIDIIASYIIVIIGAIISKECIDSCGGLSGMEVTGIFCFFPLIFASFCASIIAIVAIIRTKKENKSRYRIVWAIPILLLFLLPLIYFLFKFFFYFLLYS